MLDEKKKKRLRKAKYTLQELSSLARLANTPDYLILKRLVFRYINNLKVISFKLPEDNPQYLAKRHAELVGMAIGARQVLTILEQSANKLEIQEDEVEKLSEDNS